MHAPKSYIIGFPLHDQRENWSDCPLFSAGDKAPDYRCSTSGRGRGVHGLRSSCVVGPRGDRRGWNVTPQATRDNSSASESNLSRKQARGSNSSAKSLKVAGKRTISYKCRITKDK